METDRNGQKRTETGRNGQKLTETNRNGLGKKPNNDVLELNCLSGKCLEDLL